MLKTFAVSLCLIALLAFTMVGCSVPECEKYVLYPAMDGNGNIVLILDQDNAVKLANAMTGLRDRTCAIQ